MPWGEQYHQRLSRPSWAFAPPAGEAEWGNKTQMMATQTSPKVERLEKRMQANKEPTVFQKTSRRKTQMPCHLWHTVNII